MTLNSFWDDYIAMKHELKDSTRSNYIYMYDKYVRPEIGQKNITNIKYSDVKKFYMSLIYERGFKPNSMEIVNTILHPIFTSAVRDGYIRLNPSDGLMAEIKKKPHLEKTETPRTYGTAAGIVCGIYGTVPPNISIGFR